MEKGLEDSTIDEENEDIEDLCSITNKAHIIFRAGNDEVNNYDSKPGDYLKEDNEFN